MSQMYEVTDADGAVHMYEARSVYDAMAQHENAGGHPVAVRLVPPPVREEA